MKKWIFGLLVIAAFLALLGFIWQSAPKTMAFSIGPALPQGKVTPRLTSTWDTALLLAPDGSLWIWGGSQFQLQGLLPWPTSTTVPQRIGSGTDWTSMSSSWTHALALKSDGSLWGWGNNGSGQLAQSNPRTNFTKPTRLGSANNWSQISVGAGHSVGLKTDGTLWAWGQNESGQVGDGTTSNKFTFAQITPDKDWRTITTGGFNTYALKSNGTVWGWGLAAVAGPGKSNVLSPRQIDSDTNWASLSASDFSLLGLKSNGTLWIYGQNSFQSASQYLQASTSSFVQIGPDNDWREMYAGQGFFFARKLDGSWWVSGENDKGQLARNTSITQVPAPRRLGFDFEPWAFATGDGNCVLLTRDGNLWSWGQRLGSGESGAWPQFKNRLNELLHRFVRIAPRLQTKQPKIDKTPYWIWELPASTRRALAATALAQPQGITNSVITPMK